MMLELWRKELHSIIPFLFLMVFLVAVGTITYLIKGVPHELTYSETYVEYILSGEGEQFMTFILAMAVTTGLLVREYDEGTIEFLDGLPTSRGRVFFVKFGSAMVVMTAYIVLSMGLSVVFQAISRDSRDPGFHLGFLAVAAVLRVCQSYVMLSLGLVVSFLRRFGWLAVGLLFSAFMWLHAKYSAVDLLNFFALCDPRIEGQRIVIPYRQLGVQLAVATFLLLVAAGIFRGWGDRFVRGYQKLGTTWRGTLLLFSGSLGLLAIGFFLMQKGIETYGGDDYETDLPQVSYSDWQLARTNTTRYRISYMSNLANRVLTLAKSADNVHDTVCQFFAAEPGEPIVVDATCELERHAGSAKWNTVLLDLNSSEDNEHLKAVLAHETAHVFIDRLSNARMIDRFNSTRFFHEGLASFVEFHRFQPDEDINNYYRTAAVMKARDEIDFDQLADNSEFLTRYDTNAVYPLGLVFIEALIDSCGEASVSKIVRTAAREEASTKLTGREFWRDTFQACGYNLENVLDEYHVRLNSLVEKHMKWIDSIPALRSSFEVDNDYVRVKPVWEAADSWTPFCRFRQQADAEDSQYMDSSLDDNGEFTQPVWFYPSDKVWYQIGVRDNENGVRVFQPWLEVTIR